MIKIAVNGACGRMGTRICALIFEDNEADLTAALDHPGHAQIGKDIGLVAGFGETGIKITTTLETSADVLIDFSSPESTVNIAEWCAKKNTAIVIGTTGLTPQQHEKLQEISEKIPCLISPNMSVGVNVMFSVAAQMAKMLGKDFDIEIIETHHRFKKDSPSGTALRLAEKICTATGLDKEKNVIYGRQGIVGERPSNQIGIHAVRSGDVIGDHTVVFGALGERLEITHKAHTRDTFARGAIHTAKIIAKKQPGMYTMSDVL
ncbi:MAG: 4-hydroxy-tetrahydrodipicolinate reductase [Candidatus Kuenenia sp.]|nr:4-hydroxy-tetrahydrodipicolinate reductase [Candidatus Kuenenia hertensis]